MNATVKPISDAGQRIEELGRIIMAYSEVTERLQESHERLEKTVAALREELGDKNRQLERRNRLAALGEMAAGMAHEIRNPLGGIQLYASMLAGDLADREEPLQLVRKISAGVKRLEGLVGQVLQFSREIRPNYTTVNLGELVTQVMELTQDVARGRDVHCEISGPAQLMVRTDELLIGQAVMNLVQNAIQACEKEGCVRVEFDGGPTEREGQFRLVVSDNGTGVDPAVMDRIFNPFFTTRDTGTGLGLAIVHRIVEAHEGTITVRNQEQGGARFEIKI
ncbi:MAG: ATP-binding protein [Phycisphaerales bacterium]|jgi:signal transduction histidine kinase|nr:ATP-binding protein [Phycisphaerales bacterium]